jgi:fatty-acid desaturase
MFLKGILILEAILLQLLQPSLIKLWLIGWLKVHWMGFADMVLQIKA